MAALQSSVLAKNAANLAAQLALVESRGREESMGREKPDSRPSTGTVVSAAGDSINDSVPSSKATGQPRSGHSSPTKLDDSLPASKTTSRPTTGHSSPTRLGDSLPASRTTSRPTTGHSSPTRLDDSLPVSRTTSRPTTGHSSPTKLDDSLPTTRTTSRHTTGDTSPARLEESISTSYDVSQVTTGRTSPTKLEDTDEAQVETFSEQPECGNTVHLISGGAGEENFQGGCTPKASEVLSFSVAEAVEAFEAKTTRTKKSKNNKINNQPRPKKPHIGKGDCNEIPQTKSGTFGWAKFSLLGLTLLGLCALIYSYRYISECIIIIKFKQVEL